MTTQPFRSQFRRWYCRLFGGRISLYVACRRRDAR